MSSNIKYSKFKNLSIKSQEHLSPSAHIQNRHCLLISHLSDQGPVIKPQLVFKTAHFPHSAVLLHAVYQVLSSILSFAIYFHHFSFFFLFLVAFILVSWLISVYQLDCLYCLYRIVKFLFAFLVDRRYFLLGTKWTYILFIV